MRPFRSKAERRGRADVCGDRAERACAKAAEAAGGVGACSGEDGSAHRLRRRLGAKRPREVESRPGAGGAARDSWRHGRRQQKAGGAATVARWPEDGAGCRPPVARRLARGWQGDNDGSPVQRSACDGERALWNAAPRIGGDRRLLRPRTRVETQPAALRRERRASAHATPEAAAAGARAGRGSQHAGGRRSGLPTSMRGGRRSRRRAAARHSLTVPRQGVRACRGGGGFVAATTDSAETGGGTLRCGRAPAADALA